MIASFLRAYNDSIDDGRRQDLCGFASRVLGSRASEEIHRARVELLAAWTRDYARAQQTRWFRFFHRSEKLPRRMDHVGPYIVREIPKHTDETHANVLALVDELLGVGESRATPDARATLPAREPLEVSP